MTAVNPANVAAAPAAKPGKPGQKNRDAALAFGEAMRTARVTPGKEQPTAKIAQPEAQPAAHDTLREEKSPVAAPHGLMDILKFERKPDTETNYKAELDDDENTAALPDKQASPPSSPPLALVTFGVFSQPTPQAGPDEPPVQDAQTASAPEVSTQSTDGTTPEIDSLPTPKTETVSAKIADPAPVQVTPPTDRRASAPVADRQGSAPVADRQPSPPVADRQPSPPVADRQPTPPVADRPSPPVADRQTSAPVADRQPSPPVAVRQPASPIADKPVSTAAPVQLPRSADGAPPVLTPRRVEIVAAQTVPALPSQAAAIIVGTIAAALPRLQAGPATVPVEREQPRTTAATPDRAGSPARPEPVRIQASVQPATTSAAPVQDRVAGEAPRQDAEHGSVQKDERPSKEAAKSADGPPVAARSTQASAPVAPVQPATASGIVMPEPAKLVATAVNASVSTRETPAIPLQNSISGVQSLQIQLHPAELGMVTATLRFAGEQLTIEIQVENQEAHHRLSADSDAIVKSLRALGLDVDAVTVLQPQAAGTVVQRADGTAQTPTSTGRDQQSFTSSNTGSGGGNAGGQNTGRNSGNGMQGTQTGAQAAVDRPRGGLYI